MSKRAGMIADRAFDFGIWEITLTPWATRIRFKCECLWITEHAWGEQYETMRYNAPQQTRRHDTLIDALCKLCETHSLDAWKVAYEGARGFMYRDNHVADG